MALLLIGTLPESMTVSDVVSFDVTSDSQPRTILGRRSGLDELIYDEEGGFSDSWRGFSSLTPTDTGFTLVLGRRAFSASGVAVFYAAGGGGASGDATSIQSVPVSPVGPNVGQVLTYTESGDAEWVDPAPAGATGAAGGDLAGTYPNPTLSSAKAASLLASAASAAATADATTLASAHSYTDAAVAGVTVAASVVTADSGTSYAIIQTDLGKFRRLTSASAKTITVNPQSTTAISADYEQHFYNDGAGDATFTPGAGVTIKSPYGGSLILPQFGTATLKRLASDVWALIGVTV